MIDERKNCPMRHENGNCMSVGGFCLAVNDGICEGLRNAYKAGSFADKAEKDWHTEPPTEAGWYVCKMKGADLYETEYFTGVNWNEEIIEAWQKIEPYNGRKDK